jgi:putative tricarboxylic transport membrane protein
MKEVDRQDLKSAEDEISKREGKSRRTDKIIALALFGFSWFYLFSSLRLKLGAAHNPGPGFIPVGIGTLLLLCSTFYLVRVFGGKLPGGEGDNETQGKEKNYRAIIGILACTTIYPLILESMKFIISTAAVASAMLVLLKPRRPVFSFFLGLVMAVVSFLIFSRLLEVALPMGPVEELFFRMGGSG